MYTTPISPKQRYESLLNAGEIQADPSQVTALNALQDLYERLAGVDGRPKWLMGRSEYVSGLYLWGKVGRGKTFLMDLFVASLNPEQVLRQHFHHFMASVHRQLQALSGTPEPLRRIARDFSRRYSVLCFDEFFVSDIGDAMLLGGLLQSLFEFNVTLVATSNTPPERLYWEGLQRSRFLPAIAAIQAHTQTLHMDGGLDHRERALQPEAIYFVKHDRSELSCVEGDLLQRFELVAEGDKPRRLKVLSRDIAYVARAGRRIAFDFAALCEGPRSHLDYIDIAERFDLIILLNIPPLSGEAFERIKARGTEDGSVGSGVTGERAVVLSRSDDAARRFIALVDELYERKVRLYMTAFAPLGELYTRGALTFEFERARSRLIEMASREYQCLREPLEPA
ncbi:cell division protein ZapE [Hahella aquimaris]|uniref:cell division protein ZapE n=1 Tax=Hahella sp. HNIBRBA332 TaxID=3015983 RepID=UPI00273BD001|nr:cell division protein ZapE [Hahella sp. HNIBRBA332]WLQ13704.1 cell division protein ZapE [Hahella sp. HNIBRBA332]